MVTEADNTAGAQEQQQQPVQSEEMTSAMSAISGMGGSNTFDVGNPTPEESSLHNENSNQQPQAPVEAPVESQLTEQPSTVETTIEAPAETTAEAPAETVIESEMFETVKVDDAQSSEDAPSTLGFESFDDFDKFLTDGNYGITKENIREKLPELIETQSKFEEVSKTNEHLNTVFDKMPEELYEAIKIWGNGGGAEEYRAVINSAPSVDFSKKFEDHDSKEMVEAYFKNKVTEDDWEEFKDSDGDPDVKDKVASYIELASEKYSVSQSKFEHEKSTYETNAKQMLELRQAAFNSSRENFPKAFEGTTLEIKEDYIAKVDKSLQTQQSILAVFMNPDGSLKENAHEMMAMATEGKNVVIQQANALRNRMVSKAREEVLENTPDSHQMKKTADQGGNTNTEVEKQKIDNEVAEILGTTEQKTY